MLIEGADGGRVVSDALGRARATLFQPPEDDRREAEAEFNAYWASHGGVVLSVMPPAEGCCPTWVAALTHPVYAQIVGDSRASLARWAGALGGGGRRLSRGYHVRLSALLPPPAGQPLSLSGLFDIISGGGAARSLQNLRRWLCGPPLPATVLFSAPMASGEGDVAFAAVIPASVGQAFTRAQKGFRPGRAPVRMLLAAVGSEPVTRPTVERADRPYCVPRGGAMLALAPKKVVVAGCGAVGSDVAALLASSGVGTLRLIDHEVLTTANLYRHYLGAESLGREKASAMRDALRTKFPDLAVSARAKTIERVLDEHDGDLADADLVVLALGDETLERWLDDYFKARLPRLHVWLEPLGLGGHVLACGAPGRPGCLHCLYRRNGEHGLLNMAGLAAPGQTFRRASGGCAGTFTPFGITDAVRAAAEAAHEAVRLLGGDLTPRLTSRVVDLGAFEAAGYRASPRCGTIGSGRTEARDNFARPDCLVCGGAA